LSTRDVDAVKAAARAFVSAAFESLRESNVIPTPIYHRFVRARKRTVSGPSGRKRHRLGESLVQVGFGHRLSTSTTCGARPEVAHV